MRICLIASEFLGFGTAGGFGFATRSLGRNLVARGHEVTVVIPRPRGVSATTANVDGILLLTYSRLEIIDSMRLFRDVNAEIYHSQEPSLATYLCQRAVPDAVHVVTSRDPRDLHDWWIEFRYPSRTRLGVVRTALFYENYFCKRAVRRCSRVYVPARCLAGKVQAKYRLDKPPEFMPTPIRMPAGEVQKAERPTICYVGRLDRRKRPDRFLTLAEKLTHCDFIVVGEAQDPAYKRELEARFGNIRNLKMLGFVDQFASNKLSEVLSMSWIMVNTAAREGLPNVFIEAAAHQCAIVSAHDPDGFASRFGRWCPDADYRSAVSELLGDDRWRACGQAGAAYVEQTNREDLATASHLDSYLSLLTGT